MSIIGFKEYLNAAKIDATERISVYVTYAVLIPLQYFLIYIKWYGLFSILIPVYCFILLPFISTTAKGLDNYLQRIAFILFGVLLTVYFVSHMPALLMLEISGYPADNNFSLICFLIFTTQISDVSQYIFGKLFGRRKIAPVVSPSKTVEGFVLGGTCAVLLGSTFSVFLPFGYWPTLTMALLIVLLGFMGGLVCSAIKRSLGTKDWSELVPGHGGLLDRLDSLVFSAPVFFHVIRYFYTP